MVLSQRDFGGPLAITDFGMKKRNKGKKTWIFFKINSIVNDHECSIFEGNLAVKSEEIFRTYPITPWNLVSCMHGISSYMHGISSYIHGISSYMHGISSYILWHIILYTMANRM